MLESLRTSPRDLGHTAVAELKKLDPSQHTGNKQVAALKLVELLSKLDPDPKYNLAPKATIVGGYVINPTSPKGDIDVEVAGVSWDHLQNQLLQRSAEFEYFRRTKARPDGIITQDKTKEVVDGDIGGNAYVCVWLRLKGGHAANISIPMRTTAQTDRYDMNSVTYDPTLPFEKACERRTFAHKAIGYDALNGALIDPFRGLAALKTNTFKILDSESSQNDPVVFYTCIVEMLNNGMSPDPASSALLKKMATKHFSGANAANVSLARVAAERSKLLCLKQPPGVALRAAGNFGVFARDLPQLANLSLIELNKIFVKVNAAWENAHHQASWKPEARLVFVLGTFAAALVKVHNWPMQADQRQLKDFIQRFIHPEIKGGPEQIENCLRCVKGVLYSEQTQL